MKTSRFNNKVRVFYKEKQQSMTGQIISNLVDFGLQFAYIKYNSGKEVIKSGIVESNLVSIRMRKNQLTVSMFENQENYIIEFNNKAYSIKSVNPDFDTNRFIDFVCEVGRININNNNG